MQVYFSHSYRDKKINSYFLEHFQGEGIPLLADQKTDIWCVAKLERYMWEMTGVALSVQSMRGRVLHVIAGKGLCPLYSCLRVADPLFGSSSIQPVRGASSGPSALSRPPIAELLAS